MPPGSVTVWKLVDNKVQRINSITVILFISVIICYTVVNIIEARYTFFYLLIVLCKLANMICIQIMICMLSMIY